jgi:hypothetical protein
MLSGFWLENLKVSGLFEDLVVGGRLLLKWILGKWNVCPRTGCIWLSVGTSGRLLQTL